MKSGVIEEIERYVNLDRESLLERGVEALLKERKRNMIGRNGRKLMLEMHEILFRYHVETSAGLEEKIESGDVVEHPAWEDLIALGNLEDAISKLDEYLRNLQQIA